MTTQRSLTVLRCVVCVTVLLALHATACHAMGFDVTHRPVVQRALAAAERYWKVPSPTCDALQVVVAPITSDIAPWPGATLIPAAQVNGETDTYGCTVTLSPRAWVLAPHEAQRDRWSVLCPLIVHEYGHIIGHSDNPGDDVMNPWSDTYAAHATTCHRR